ncbi:MAG: ABC transporter permease [Candidatus Cryosericum sp.]|nr:ABC transporter permease [bacterium]
MLRFEKRDKTPIQLRLLVPAVSVLLGLLVGSVVMLFARVNPLKAYGAIVKGAFGSGYTFSETLVIAVPLILISAGLCLVYRMKFLNIGAKGQYIIGAICGSYLALFGPATLSRPLLLTLMMVLGMIGGALWAIIPALLKVYWNVNEVIATLLLNYIASYILWYFMYGTWGTRGFPLSKNFAVNAQLPRILPAPSRLHIGLFFALAAAVVIWVIIRKTRFGYEAMVIGENERAARYAGINVVKTVIIAAAISGGLDGLAGIAHTSAVLRLLQLEINSDYGYTAIIVAWLAGLDPLVAVGVSVLLAALEAGGYQIQIVMRVPFGIVGVIESAILFCLLAGEIVTHYHIRLTRRVAA